MGEVAAIRFSDDLSVKDVFVEMKVQDRFRARIRDDSEARIDTVGVLGDKYVAISIGDPEMEELMEVQANEGGAARPRMWSFAAAL